MFTSVIKQQILTGMVVILIGVLGYQFWSHTVEKDHYQDLLSKEKDKVTKLTEQNSNIRSDYQKAINERNKIEIELKKIGDGISTYLYNEYVKYEKQLDSYKEQLLVDDLPIYNVSDSNETNTTAESIKNIDSLHIMYQKVKR